MLKVRYIACYNKDESLCTSVKGLVDFIQINEKFTITSDSLVFHSNEDKFESKLYINVSLSDVSQEVVFTIGFDFKTDIKNYRLLSLMRFELVKMLKRIEPNSFKIILTRDDIASSFGIKAYPLVQEVENGMRDMIARFMLTKIGSTYFNKYNHKDIVSKINRVGIASEDYDSVYSLDFIDIINVLTKKYSTIDENKVQSILLRIKESPKTRIEELEEFIKKSNYQRYFYEIVGIDELLINKAWKELYTYRNKIAHNRGLTLKEFRQVTNLHNYFITDVIKKLESAVDKIELSKDDVIVISEFGAISPGSSLFDEDYLKVLKTLSQKELDNLAESWEGIRAVFSGSNNVDQMILQLLDSIEWDFEEKKAHLSDDTDGDYQLNNIDDLVQTINQIVVNKVMSDLPLNVLKEHDGFDYETEIIEYLVKRKNSDLNAIGWTEYS